MDDDVLTLPSGRFRVRRDDRMIRALGLRYATARRFEPCVPLPAVAGVVDATERGPVCPQAPSRLEFIVGSPMAGLQQDEDCLALAVVAPLPDDASRPVMVFFHGGAYVTGSGQAPAYDLSAMADEGDVVTVTVNYRVGIFGYLAIDDVSPANLGLLDQIAALRWVKENISGFGGNPNDVTIFGQSAGGDSVSYLMVADGTEDLFRRAILQSAPLGVQRGRAAMSRAMGKAARGALGTRPEQAGTEDLLVAQGAAAASAARFGTRAQMPFGPQTGHYPLPADDEVDVRRREVARRLPVMIGTTADDALPFLMLNPRLAPVLGVPMLGSAAQRALSAAVTERLFARPASAFAKQHRRAGGHATTYVFDWKPAGSPFGACHCIELPFLMGSFADWEGAPMLGAEPQQALAELGPPMRQLWYGFASGMFDEADADLRLPGALARD
ncbi:MAG: para-nitrobenzyl esterase [Mycobacterium sp.]|jgi:para-nitrobenzyl esterase|nr:para-nitrobenzyl esterase [Mycobacterium sp.]